MTWRCDEPPVRRWLGQRVLAFPLGDLLRTIGVRSRAVAELAQEGLQRRFAVGDDRHVGAHVLADLGWIDVDVDDLRVRRERRVLAHRAVVEADADADDEVRLIDRIARVRGAVHAQHAEVQLVVPGKLLRPSSVLMTGMLCLLGELAQLVPGLAR